MNVDKIEDDIRLFKADFKQHPHEFLTSKWVLEKIPYIFNNDSEAYIKTKLKLASMIHVDSCSIIFVGSASTGFSLSPMKNFRKFNAKSDWKTQARMTLAAKVDLTPEEFGRRGQFYFGLSAFEGFEFTDAFTG